MQLDLFGFPQEEKPVKKQEKKEAVEKTPVKQDEAPERANASKPGDEEYTEVNIHVIPGLRQISILDAEAVTSPTVPKAAAEQAEAIAQEEPVDVKERQPVEEIQPTIPEAQPIKDEPFIPGIQLADEIPVAVLEAMAEETAILEEVLNELSAEEVPVLAAVEVEEATVPAEPLAEHEVVAETELTEELPVEAIEAMAREAAILEEFLAVQAPIAKTEQPIEVPEDVVEEPAILEAPVAEQEAIIETDHLIEQVPGQPDAVAETSQVFESATNQPAALEFHAEPTGVYEEEPTLMLPATDDVIDINQTLFSKQSVDEMVSPAKRAALKTKGKRGRKSFKDIDAELVLVEVPDDEELFQKLYYPISQVAQWFNVNTSLLRFWENEFDILKPRKNRKGDRLFRPEDVKNLQVIYHLLRQRKFSIEGAKKYIKQNKSRAEINIQLIQSLTKFRSFLLEMKANLGA